MGSLFSKAYEALNIFTLNRRSETYGFQRSKSPESSSSTPSSTNNNNNNNNKEQTATTTTTIKETVRPIEPCSDFYWACRNNNIEKIQKLLDTLSQDEIDRIEPNGSTALHAATYHGHTEIVRLLLERGADRSIPNKYHCLPFDEAPSNEIKQLFYRIPDSNRLIMDNGTIEWELIDDDVLEKAIEERKIIENIYQNNTLEKMFEKIQKNYIEKGLINTHKVKDIKHFFEKATKEKDPKWIIKAYTAETDFYNVLNAEIAGGASKYQSERRYIIALLVHHPILDSLTYIGISYRVMKVTDDQLEKYEINSFAMTKSFLSSSIDQRIAALFLIRQEKEKENQPQTRHNIHGKLIKSWIMCKYSIKHKRTALHIENHSQYTAEGEVLIMPFTVFKIKSKQNIQVNYLPDTQNIQQIEFEECDQYAIEDD